MIETREKLVERIMVLNDRLWEGRVPRAKIDEWLGNFTGKVTDIETERLHALFWLSQFMYFGGREIRVLLKSLYRDLFFCPMIQEVRASLPANASEQELMAAINAEVASTRFFGVGNPSESGVHLLYYFRQENGLSKDNFMDAVQIFNRENTNGQPGARTLRNPNIKRYIFLDDICGSGDTAVSYSKEVIYDLLQLNPDAKVAYHSLFATVDGLDNIRSETLFKENCSAVYELDASYRCASVGSRYFKTADYPAIDPVMACRIAKEYGEILGYASAHACGYNDSQMLMGFHHNTPDNTLPIMWHDHMSHQGNAWNPIFKRYPKISGGSL
ncbi:hypothetical protein [Acidovorax carolinensis]|uniref:phosphoribosyltransferase-like protein n=1 Tax=Acidovorax carolinensis TaxID=553814 RepID=UPI003AAD5AE2